MRWLMWLGGALLALIVVAVIVLFALRFRKGAGVLHTEIAVQRPPEQVFPWVAEGERTKQWMSWLVEVRESSPGVQGVGAKKVYVMDDPNMKRKTSMNVEVTRWEPPHRLGVHLSGEGYGGDVDYTLTARPDGSTLLQYEARFQIENPIFRLMEPIVMPQARAKAEMDLATLKRVVEAEPAKAVGGL